MSISGSIKSFTLIWVSLERSFPPQKLNIDDANFGQYDDMMSEVEQWPRLITASYGWHISQWVKVDIIFKK